jgi:single-strand DNA-binding protein
MGVGGNKMAVNKAICVGNLGRDPEVRHIPSGQAVANFTLATSDFYTDREGARQERTDWHNIVVYGKQAELCGQYLKKGRQCYVEGRLQTREYEAKDGSGKRYRTEIVAQRVQFLGGRTSVTDGGPADLGGGGPNTPPAMDDEDIPFLVPCDISPERRFRV